MWDGNASIPSRPLNRGDLPDLRAFLGREVHLVIDRPLGTVHPRHAEIVYPVNYGYVPGTLAGDGEPIDAYLLGVHEPVAEAKGMVIALIVRNDDIEDKLVVAPAGMRFSAAEIRDIVRFQERYFDSRVVMREATP